MGDNPAATVNQIDCEQLRAFAGKVSAAPELADREPRVVARWVGDSRAQVTFGETSSPVGDTLTRPVPATLNLDVRAS
jgi:hypothetical protein